MRSGAWESWISRSGLFVLKRCAFILFQVAGSKSVKFLFVLAPVQGRGSKGEGRHRKQSPSWWCEVARCSLNLLQTRILGHQLLESVARKTDGQLGVVALAFTTNNHAHSIFGMSHVAPVLESFVSPRFCFSSWGQINLFAALLVEFLNTLNSVVSRSFVSSSLSFCLSIGNIVQ